VTRPAALAGGGVVAGVLVLIRGLRGYRTSLHLEDTSTSTIAALAVGEVRVSGTVEPAELALASPLQDARCVYYRASIREAGRRGDGATVFEEERAVGFRVRDGTGSLRVFPRAARWDVPDRFDERSGLLGETPAGLRMRTGPALVAADPDHETQVAALLRVAGAAGARSHPLLESGRGSRRYREARIEPGDTVTVLGKVLPFSELPDPTGADVGSPASTPADDPETAASIAAAGEAGTLLADPMEAWGNAAIPGFGIGRPTRAPELHPDATPAPLATSEEAARTERTFSIAARDLVLAASPVVPLLIAFGPPGHAVERHRRQFMLGLLGAVVAIGSAMAFAILVTIGGDA
jgi:hypothetical protein